jgi:hypothetical protein
MDEIANPPTMAAGVTFTNSPEEPGRPPRPTPPRPPKELRRSTKPMSNDFEQWEQQLREKE